MPHRRIVTYTLPKTPSGLTPDDMKSWMNDVGRILAVIMAVLQRPDIHIYTLATLPDASDRNIGEIVLVSDGAAGAQYRGSTGTAWVNLG